MLRPLYLSLVLITFPIGLVVSYLVVVVLFFGVITPVAIVFRLMGRDALHRRIDRHASTYWTQREITAQTERYFRQY
jgi:hypothetical protein